MTKHVAGGFQNLFPMRVLRKSFKDRVPIQGAGPYAVSFQLG